MDRRPNISLNDATALREVPEHPPFGIGERLLEHLRPFGHALDDVSRRLRTTWLGDRLHAHHFGSLELTEVEASMPGLGELDGLTIAWLSDLHVGPFMDADDLTRLFETVAERSPDLVCLGGDMVTSALEEVELLSDALTRLDPPHGVLAVLGNHEYHSRSTYDVAGFLRRHGVEVLLNGGQRLQRDGASLWIGGIDDWLNGQPDVDSALAGRRADEPTLLLSHNPDAFPDAARANIDLTLSGHTHGGQIRLLGWAPIRDGSSSLYIGRGAGTTVLPIRIGSKPEVPFVTLRDAGANAGRQG